MSSSVRLVEPQQSFPIFRASLSKQGEFFWSKELRGKQTRKDIAVEDKKRLEEQKKSQTSVWDLLIGMIETEQLFVYMLLISTCSL